MNVGAGLGAELAVGVDVKQEVVVVEEEEPILSWGSA